ncbi:MAG: hypothetical protein AAB830_02055 [Patescibacteria group bacterium]
MREVMTQNPIKSPDMSVLTKKHANKWVALSADYKKLLAVGANLSVVLKKAGDEEKVVMKVLPNLGYAPIGV